MDIWQITILVGTAVLAAAIKSSVGIGAGLLCIPMLSLAFSAKVALAIGAPIMFLTDMCGIKNYWGEWGSLKAATKLLAAGLSLAVITTVLLPYIPLALFQAGIGVFGVGYAICNFFNFSIFGRFLTYLFPVKGSEQDKTVYIYGALGGVASVLAHSGGTIWSMYMLKQNLDKRQLISSLIFMFLISDAYKTAAFWMIGLTTWRENLWVLATLPLVWWASRLGNNLNKKMSTTTVRHVVLAIIFFMSANLLVKSLSGQ